MFLFIIIIIIVCYIYLYYLARWANGSFYFYFLFFYGVFFFPLSFLIIHSHKCISFLISQTHRHHGPLLESSNSSFTWPKSHRFYITENKLIPNLAHENWIRQDKLRSLIIASLSKEILPLVALNTSHKICTTLESSFALASN